MTLSLNVIVSNLETLKNFKVGQKPVIDSKTGLITVEDRERMVGLRRWWYGAFNPEGLARTFQEALPHIKINEIKFYDTKEYPEFQKTVYENFLPALQGVLNIATTYKNEKKNDTEKKVRKIVEQFQNEFEMAKADIPLAPDRPAEFEQFQKADIPLAPDRPAIQPREVRSIAVHRTKCVIREASQRDLQKELLQRVSSLPNVHHVKYEGVGTGKAHEKPILQKQASFYDPRLSEEHGKILAALLTKRRYQLGEE